MIRRILRCGIDEAGRGPLAGPVSAAAVILPEQFDLAILDDSKKLSAARRESARACICSGALAWGVGWASPEEIDSINILQASLLAMKRAFIQMLECETLQSGLSGDGQPFSIEAIVDGLYTPDITVPCAALVKADSQIPEVMAASILAKTARDEEMDRYAKLYPAYGFDKHKGYPTAAHRAAIIKYGPSPIQRMTFTVKPVLIP
jgi:ribonuclease HII